MNVTYWTGFSKRKNSTKRPATTGTDVTCNLKDDTSILFPDIDSATIPANANYMYISDFGRYYYVRDVTKVGASRNAFHLEVDPMGSYKSNIGSTNAFIMYATGGYNTLIDTRIPMKSGIDAPLPATASFPWSIDPLNGRYILTVMTKDGVKTYNMGFIQIVQLLSNLSNWTDDLFNNIPAPSSNDWDAIIYGSRVLWAIGKQIMSFSDSSACLVNCVWLPINYTVSNSDRVYLGNFDTGVDADYMSNSILSPSPVTISIPWLYSDWRNNSPYCQMYLYVPFVGNINIDPSLIIGQSTLTLKFALARCSGDCSLEISAGPVIIGTYGVNLAAKYPVGAMQADPIKQATSVIGAVGGIAATAAGIASGNPAAIIGGIGATVGSPAGFNPTPTTLGGMGGGSGAGLDQDIKLTLLYHDTIEAPGASNATIGKPVMSTHTISTYSGYVQCSSASVDIPGYPEEKDTVNGYVNSGFYYE